MKRRPTVVLLHGLARTHRSMDGLRRHLEAAGYSTWARSYPSRHLPIVDLATLLAQQIRDELPEEPLLAVTHSLGGILVRHMAALLPWRRVVMVAPPNRGSRVAQLFRDQPLFRWFYGPAGQEVADPDGWPAPPEPFAVIAGTRAFSPTNPTSWVTHPFKLLAEAGPSDGTVTVEETRLSGMADFATIDASHTLILRHPQVRAWIVQFLERGRFR